MDCSGKRCRFIGVPYPPSVQLQAGANSQPNFPPSTASALADTTQSSVPADLNNAIDIKSTDVSSLPISISDNIDSSTQDQRCSLLDFEPSSIPVFNWGSVDSDISVIRLKQVIVKLFTGETTVLKYLLETLVRNLCWSWPDSFVQLGKDPVWSPLL